MIVNLTSHAVNKTVWVYKYPELMSSCGLIASILLIVGIFLMIYPNWKEFKKWIGEHLLTDDDLHDR